MFRNYVNESLDLNEYNKILKNAPEGQKYCNAFCQKFMDESEFYDNRANCKICFNQISKARKMIDCNQITIEQFKNNPSLVVRENQIFPFFVIVKLANLIYHLINLKHIVKNVFNAGKRRRR